MEAINPIITHNNILFLCDSNNLTTLNKSIV